MKPLHRSARQEQGHQWEEQALVFLQSRGLKLVERNFRCRGGELDLIMRAGAVLVFVEVRQRSAGDYGGAAASITPAKVRRLVVAAQTWMLRLPSQPACRFDVVTVDGERIGWLRNVIEG
jgi:putative endonuclease